MSTLATKRESLAVNLAKEFSGQQAIITIPQAFIRLTGDYQAAAVLSQLLYWWGENGKQKFPKSDTEIEKTMFLSRRQLSRVRGLLSECGVLMSYEGLPKRTHYDFDEAVLGQCLLNLLEDVSEQVQLVAPFGATSGDETVQLAEPKGAACIDETVQHYKDNSISKDIELKELKKEEVVEEEKAEETFTATATGSKIKNRLGERWREYLEEHNGYRKQTWLLLSEEAKANAFVLAQKRASNLEKSFRTHLKEALDEVAQNGEAGVKDFPAAPPKRDLKALAQLREDKADDVWNRSYHEALEGGCDERTASKRADTLRQDFWLAYSEQNGLDTGGRMRFRQDAELVEDWSKSA